jgi:cation diffusion facilitator family transporter
MTAGTAGGGATTNVARVRQGETAFGASRSATPSGCSEGELAGSPSLFALVHYFPHRSVCIPYRYSMADQRPPLTRFAWLAVGAAVLTIGLKAGAYLLTGSVGLLSDALESLVNLVAAIAALIALTVAEKAPDEEHAFGHGKAEYFSSGLEGALVLVAAAVIVVSALPRLLHPVAIEQVGWGLAVSTLATLINLAVAQLLLRAGARYRSITLEADARHLMTDVWTTAGVVVGIGVVAVTGWTRLDPVIALAVAANIVWTGVGLVRRSLLGLLDTALPEAERRVVATVLERYQREAGIQAHALRTREAGARRFVSVHILVPGSWTVHQGHQLLEAIEHDIREALPNTTVFTHLESLDDPASFADTALDRRPLNAEAKDA